MRRDGIPSCIRSSTQRVVKPKRAAICCLFSSGSQLGSRGNWITSATRQPCGFLAAIPELFYRQLAMSGKRPRGTKGPRIARRRYNSGMAADPGEVLRRARKRNGVKQSELARRAGTTQSAISRIENGGRSPTVEYLEKLLGALDEELRLDSGPPSGRTPRKAKGKKKTGDILY